MLFTMNYNMGSFESKCYNKEYDKVDEFCKISSELLLHDFGKLLFRIFSKAIINKNTAIVDYIIDCSNYKELLIKPYEYYSFTNCKYYIIEDQYKDPYTLLTKYGSEKQILSFLTNNMSVKYVPFNYLVTDHLIDRKMESILIILISEFNSNVMNIDNKYIEDEKDTYIRFKSIVNDTKTHDLIYSNILNNNMNCAADLYFSTFYIDLKK